MAAARLRGIVHCAHRPRRRLIAHKITAPLQPRVMRCCLRSRHIFRADIFEAGEIAGNAHCYLLASAPRLDSTRARLCRLCAAQAGSCCCCARNVHACRCLILRARLAHLGGIFITAVPYIAHHPLFIAPPLPAISSFCVPHCFCLRQRYRRTQEDAHRLHLAIPDLAHAPTTFLLVLTMPLYRHYHTAGAVCDMPLRRAPRIAFATRAACSHILPHRITVRDCGILPAT